MEISEVMIIEQLSYIKQSCEKIKGRSTQYIISSGNQSRRDLPWTYSSLCGEVDVIIKEYNWMVPHINKFLEGATFSFKLEELELINVEFKKMSEENTYPSIDKKLVFISLQCNKILSIMKNIATSTKEMKNKFNSLAEEIKNLEKEKISKNTIKNLKEALTEFELNRLLGTTLICGRVAIFYLDSISGDINEKIEKLSSKSLVGSKGSKEMILKANQKIRGLFAHDINYFPSASETLSIFGDTVYVVKIINNYLLTIDKENSQIEV